MKKNSSIFIIFLALGVFGIITTEMGIIGVLPQVADRFHITASKAGWLVSIFALVVAVSGPFLTLLASGLNRKYILLLAVLMFAVSNTVYAYTEHFNVLIAFRIIPALCHPVFFSVALAAAARLVPADQSGKAVTKVFSGITVGFAFGVPFTSYLAERLSLEAAFLFGAMVSIIAFAGILLFLPSMPVKEKMSFRSQLGILRKTALWLNIGAVICLFAAMFSVYSYFAEYLGQVTHMNGSWISLMLMSFGVIMIAGNFVFGVMLHKNTKKTVILFPLLYTAAYFLVYGLGTSFILMAVLVFVWGAVHSGGLIVSQTWLIAEAKEAPEFGNSLFVSFSNLGITLGTAAGGWFISRLGIHQLIWCGMLFALLAFGLMMGRLALGNRKLAEN
ncbi:MFS transporter [Bacillus sp. ISL-51]|uniref:MFS transporter n=1 Tax=Bacteria TaxID=2 RepID=UPI001BE73E04|nr:MULTISPECIES: MFS transporter [unclassified Bacillus (in: firmicutes)]MBT2574960.1 MFS transporter [Bacillus sp. ISL-51]MBT2634203.1 MFS transporter [Bacillus sp. ISL-26]MBT2713770.1 MFS transporter [Pseudomonas sp. ISL-88]